MTGADNTIPVWQRDAAPHAANGGLPHGGRWNKAADSSCWRPAGLSHPMHCNDDAAGAVCIDLQQEECSKELEGHCIWHPKSQSHAAAV